MSQSAQTCGGMAAPRSLLASLSALLLLLPAGCCSPSGRRTNQDRCGSRVLAAPAEGSRRLAVTFRADNCSLNCPLGKHVIQQVSNVSFSHLSCEDQAAVIVHWAPSPLGIEHVKGFRVYLEDKNPENKQCQHLLLKEPRQLNFSYRSTKLSSLPFSGLTFDTDYMVRVVPFPSLMNESFFVPSFIRTNSCEVLLGAENLVCKPFWKPKILNVSQLGSNLHVTFDQAPPSFGFSFYVLCYKLRQDGPFRLQRCKPDLNQPRTTCVLRNVTPGTYTVELRDSNNTTRRQTQCHVSQVHSPWAGPIRAVAITVPLVIMSAFATLFTVMCRKKQQENIYSQLDEESSESSNHGAALSAERPWPRPKVFLCYSNRDGPKHMAVIQSLAYFLQDFCGCEVVLDLWEHLEMCKEGQMSWLSRQLDEAHFIITVCSKGLRYLVEKKSRRGKTPINRRSNNCSTFGGSGGDLFLVGVAMIAEKLRLAKQSDGGGTKELTRYMAVYFDYSSENDIPTMLSLAPRFKLMDQLPQLFARLHSIQPGSSDRDQLPLNISRRNYFRSKSGRSLYVAICNMHQHISQNPHWLEQQLDPSAAKNPPHLPPKPSDSAPSDAAPSSQNRFNPGLVLNNVVVRTPSLEGEEAVPRRNVLLPAPSPSLSLPHCSMSMLKPSLRPTSVSGLSPDPSPTVLQEEAGPAFAQPEDAARSAAEVPAPRDSGIYDSSVPSSELSIPLMEGLSHDQADSSSLADSESSSSGLGDEELPAVASLSCRTSLVCKAELHQHHDALSPIASL